MFIPAKPFPVSPDSSSCQTAPVGYLNQHSQRGVLSLPQEPTHLWAFPAWLIEPPFQCSGQILASSLSLSLHLWCVGRSYPLCLRQSRIRQVLHPNCPAPCHCSQLLKQPTGCRPCLHSFHTLQCVLNTTQVRARHSFLRIPSAPMSSKVPRDRQSLSASSPPPFSFPDFATTVLAPWLFLLPAK